jgi:hypothetical protein
VIHEFYHVNIVMPGVGGCPTASICIHAACAFVEHVANCCHSHRLNGVLNIHFICVTVNGYLLFQLWS